MEETAKARKSRGGEKKEKKAGRGKFSMWGRLHLYENGSIQRYLWLENLQPKEEREGKAGREDRNRTSRLVVAVRVRRGRSHRPVRKGRGVLHRTGKGTPPRGRR